ncbi:MAG: hypothetical protein REJ23_13620, partial [Brevundimonas sp.]|nr:hypothetical protein [Brevundimonas sp.]
FPHPHQPDQRYGALMDGNHLGIGHRAPRDSGRRVKGDGEDGRRHVMVAFTCTRTRAGGHAMPGRA